MRVAQNNDSSMKQENATAATPSDAVSNQGPLQRHNLPTLIVVEQRFRILRRNKLPDKRPIIAAPPVIVNLPLSLWNVNLRSSTIHGFGSKRKLLGTTGVGLFFLLPIVSLELLVCLGALVFSTYGSPSTCRPSPKKAGHRPESKSWQNIRPLFTKASSAETAYSTPKGFFVGFYVPKNLHKASDLGGLGRSGRLEIQDYLLKDSEN